MLNLWKLWIRIFMCSDAQALLTRVQMGNYTHVDRCPLMEQGDILMMCLLWVAFISWRQYIMPTCIKWAHWPWRGGARERQRVSDCVHINSHSSQPPPQYPPLKQDGGCGQFLRGFGWLWRLPTWEFLAPSLPLLSGAEARILWSYVPHLLGDWGPAWEAGKVFYPTWFTWQQKQVICRTPRRPPRLLVVLSPP